MQGKKIYQEKLFTNFLLSERVPEQNFYRRLKSVLDLNYLYGLTAPYYGSSGQKSIDPLVFFKLCLVGYLENIISDRKLIQHSSMRLDILYFIGYDLEDELPWHSTISRTRQLFPEAIFEEVFTKVLEMCILKGMVSGHTQAIDSAPIKANASMDSVELKVPEEDLESHLQKIRHISARDKETPIRSSKINKANKSQQIITANSQELGAVKSRNKKWAKDQDQRPGAGNKGSRYTSNKTHYSPTDPDARISVKPGKAKTEGDTLAQAFKSDYGNYSDGFRKAFHHETISYYRRTDREYVDIERPCLSTVLSGTPKQIQALVPSAENGLFSRFMFYYMNIKPTWKNVFQTDTTNGLDEYYDQLGKEFFGLYKTLKNNPDIEVRLTTEQQQKFNVFFEKLQTKYLNLQPDDYIATVRRLGLIAFRIIMLFSVFRIMEDGDVNQVRYCEDIDFENTLEMISVLVKHSSKVFNDLPIEQKEVKRANRKERFLEALPYQFSRQDYLNIADKNKIPHKTAEGYITKFVDAGLIHREAHNNYTNPTKAQ